MPEITCGSYSNRKITTKEDLPVEYRVGKGMCPQIGREQAMHIRWREFTMMGLMGLQRCRCADSCGH